MVALVLSILNTGAAAWGKSPNLPFACWSREARGSQLARLGQGEASCLVPRGLAA